jgi:hypothetical protein
VLSSGNLSIFSNHGRPTPKNAVRERYLSEIEFRQAHDYVIFNCDELRPFIKEVDVRLKLCQECTLYIL